MLGTKWREFHSQILKYLNLVQFAEENVPRVLERKTEHFHNYKITQPTYLHAVLKWMDIKWVDNHWSLKSTYNSKHLTAVDFTKSSQNQWVRCNYCQEHALSYCVPLLSKYMSPEITSIMRKQARNAVPHKTIRLV